MLSSVAERFDTHKISGVTKTPQGGRRIPAALTRVGVFSYRRADGSTVRELRPPEEVFHKDSLSTLRGCTVTDGHPKQMVNPANFRELSLGHVGDNVRGDDSKSHVLADVIVNAGDAVARIDDQSREDSLKEISCGYALDVDPTPGTFNGERYDQVQRNIRYNHTGLGVEGWARQGSSVSLRLDSGDAVLVAAEPENKTPTEEKKQMATIRIDGVECEPNGATHISLLEKRAAEQATRADSAGAKLKAETSRADGAEGKLEALTKEHETLKGKLEVAEDPKRLDGLVAARATLLADALLIVPEDQRKDSKGEVIRLDGTAHEIRVASLKMSGLDVSRLDGKSEDYVVGVFEQTVASAFKGEESRERNDGLGSLNTASRTVVRTEQRTDSHAEMRKRNQDAWKQPLAHSKDSAN